MDMNLGNLIDILDIAISDDDCAHKTPFSSYEQSYKGRYSQETTIFREFAPAIIGVVLCSGQINPQMVCSTG